jgi:hypothetical protein
MFTVIYLLLLPICSFILCVFGFFVGRCARKLPFIDDGLPWTLSRSQIPPPPNSAEPGRLLRRTSGYSSAEIARLCEAAGWAGPGKTGEQASPHSPESRTGGRAA